MSDDQIKGSEQGIPRDETVVADRGAAPETTGDDPLQRVAGAMITAAQAVQHGASDAKSRAQQMAPAVGRAISKSIYATCYYLSYGVVFPTLLVTSLIPTNNAMGHGLSDGAAAAKDSVNHLWERRAAVKAAYKRAREEAASAGVVQAHA